MQAVALRDNSVVMMGGWGAQGLLNDVWRSSDGGRSWILLDASAPWAPRWWFAAVYDESNSRIYVLGGQDSSNLFLGDVWALDVNGILSASKGEVQAGSTYSLVPAGGSSSKPTGSLLCLEGSRSATEAALSSLLASPLAAIYEHAEVMNQPCENRGFPRLASSSDECFSALSLHYAPRTLQPYPGVPHTDLGNLYEWEGVIDGLLVGHDFNHGNRNGTAASKVCQRKFIERDSVKFMVSPESDLPTYGSVGSHVPDAGLLCNEGPLEGDFTIYDMVDLLKNGSLAAIQQRDGVLPVPCSARGFPVSQGVADHCYPPAVLWYTGNIFSLFRAEWLETGAMLSYDFDHSTSPGTGQHIAECDCREGSEVRRGLPSGFCS